MGLERIIRHLEKLTCFLVVGTALLYQPACSKQTHEKLPEKQAYSQESKEMPPLDPNHQQNDDLEGTFGAGGNIQNESFEQAKQRMSLYFPLNQGNTWKYKRIVSPGKDVFACALETIQEPVPFSNNPEDLFAKTRLVIKKTAGLPQISEETYTITGESEGFYLNVRIEGNNPRDGRYFLSKNSESKRCGWANLSNLILEALDKGCFGRDNKHETNVALLFESCSNIEPSSFDYSSKRTLPDPPYKHSVVNRFNGKIKVPAGEFSDLILNVAMINGKNLNDVVSGNAQPQYHLDEKKGIFGFITLSYYANRVGLVKEIQYNEKNEPTYILDLVDFDLKWKKSAEEPHLK